MNAFPKLISQANYFIVDQLLDSKNADFLEERLLNTVSFPWFASFMRDDFSSVGKSKWKGFRDHPGFLEGPQLCHSVVFRGKVMNSGEFRMIKALRCAVSQLFDSAQLKIERCKYNLQFQRPGNEVGKFNCPHRDCAAHQIVMVYYVNDCDGRTHLFKDENLSILESVESKKGRAVFFYGDTLHAGQNPIDSPVRCVINMNFSVLTDNEIGPTVPA